MKWTNSAIIIARKEFTNALRDRVLATLAAIIWLLMLAAVITGIAKVREADSLRARAGQMFRHEWEEQEANPHSAAHFGTYLFKPNTFLGAYDNGLNNYLGISYRVEAHVQHELNQSIAEDTDSQLRFGEISVSLVCQLLFPLLIIFICFNAVTKEREGNTMRMLRLQGAGPAAILWGKILGNYAIILTIVLPVFLLLGIPVISSGTGSDMFARYLLFVAAYLAYFFIVTSFCIFISAWHKSSGASLVTSLGVWICFCVLIPRLAVRMIDHYDRLPSRFELNRAITLGNARGMDKDGSRAERYTKYLKETLARYKVDSVTQLPVNFDGLAMQYGEDYNTKVYHKFASEITGVIKRQQTKLELLGFIDPFITVQQVSMGLAGTDYFHHLDFHSKAMLYRDDFVRALNLDLANSGSKYLSYEYKVGPEFFKKMKDFKYNPPRVGFALRSHQWAWLSFPVWLLAVVLLLRISANLLNREQ